MNWVKNTNEDDGIPYHTLELSKNHYFDLCRGDEEGKIIQLWEHRDDQSRCLGSFRAELPREAIRQCANVIVSLLLDVYIHSMQEASELVLEADFVEGEPCP
jgi:hypothetical protein